MKGKGNSLVLQIRDKFFPNFLLRVNSGDGVLPLQKGDLVAQSLWIHGEYEDEDRAVIRRMLRGFDRFIDVGANIGIYSLLAARCLRPGGQVFAFEPSGLEYAKLQKTISWNKLTNVTTVRAAVGDAEGEVEFFESMTGAGALNRIGKPGKPNLPFQKIVVPCVRLDDYFKTLGDAKAFIKVDVEGFELPVLEGARALLSRSRPTIMMEMVDSRSSERSSPAHVWDFLVSMGYGWYGPGGPGGPLVPLSQNIGEARNLFAIHADEVERVGGLLQ